VGGEGGDVTRADVQRLSDEVERLRGEVVSQSEINEAIHKQQMRIGDLEEEIAEARKDAEEWENVVHEIDAILDAPKQAASVCSVVVEAVKRLNSENAALRAELREALLEIAGTPPEALWEMEEHRLDYVTIQVDKKDYEAARKRLEELNG
jgi:predicted RNase H-like nuclease (RuvC/YqgF family)